MGVKVKNLSPFGGSGGTGITSSRFSDAFTRANSTSDLGPNWMSSHGRPTTAGIYSDARVLTNQMRCFRTGGAGNTTPGSFWMPLPTISELYGERQFAQVTFAAITVTTGPACGPAVMVTPDIQGNTATGYFLEVISAIAANIRSMAAGAFTLLGGPFTVATGDVLRLEAIPAAGSNQILFRRNGTLITTITDALATRPIQTGSPGMFLFLDNGDTLDFDDYSCGPA